MKLNIFFVIIIFTLFTSCTQKEVKKETVKPDTKETKEVKKESAVKKETVSSGWNGNDTYTVKASAENLDKAKSKAKNQILQDIVKVRMRSDSRYTDITKISKEFEKPLKEGRVISEQKINSGVEIYFQIKDEGLREKFEKK
jgi:uncharacterized protein (DUF342 family)